MDATIFISDKVGLDQRNVRTFIGFIQGMANRIGFGHCRYGHPDKSKRYFSKMKEEMRAYARTGNAEHLRNAALYAALEEIAPQHPKFHFDNTVDSVTRGKFL
jgi:hypothetical protein